MAVWICSACGWEKEARCKPRKCPECGGGTFDKKASDRQPATAPGTPAATGATKRSAARRRA